jgi:hypothetical protein
MDKQQCPEFPYFGAKYPDARCIDGYLWDLDSDEDGRFTHGGDDPCPFCNTEEYIKFHMDDDWGPSREAILAHIESLKAKYGYPTTPSVDQKGGEG